MTGTTTSVDLRVTLETSDRLDVDIFNDEVHVTDAKIERVFGGGGSSAEVEIIFEELLNPDTKEDFERLIEADTVSQLPPDLADNLSQTFGIPLEDLPERIEDPFNMYVVDQEDITFDDIFPTNSEPVGNSLFGPRAYYNEFYGGKPIASGILDTFYATADVIPGVDNFENYPDNVEELMNASYAKKVAVSHAVHKDQSEAITGSSYYPLNWVNDDPNLRGSRPLPKNSVAISELEVQDIDPEDAAIASEQLRQVLDITMMVDVEVYSPLLAEIGSEDPPRIRERIFTGTVTKIEESKDRTVTLEALDTRFQLNRNSVFTNTPAGGKTVQQFITETMRELNRGRVTGESEEPETTTPPDEEQETDEDAPEGGRAIEYTIYKNSTDPNSDFTAEDAENFSADRRDNEFDTLVVNTSWGVKSHTTVYEFFQNLMKLSDGTMHINRNNEIEFWEEYPDHTVWGQNFENDFDSFANPDGDNFIDTRTLSPIVEWTNAEEEDNTNVIAEADYDETGLGVYSVVSEERVDAVQAGAPQNIDITDASAMKTRPGVISREAVQQSSDFSEKSKIAMRDSGVVTIHGDPRVRAYDEIVLSQREIDSFSPISSGKYMVKTARHKFNTQDGYVTELELGEDPDKLFNAFTSAAGSQDRSDTGESGPNVDNRRLTTRATEGVLGFTGDAVDFVTFWD